MTTTQELANAVKKATDDLNKAITEANRAELRVDVEVQTLPFRTLTRQDGVFARGGDFPVVRTNVLHSLARA